MKRIAFKFLLFLLFFSIVCSGISYILRNDEDVYTRTVMSDLYKQEKIDYLFIGASHVSHGIYPSMVEKATGKSVFCASTSAQSIDGSYVI